MARRHRTILLVVLVAVLGTLSPLPAALAAPGTLAAPRTAAPRTTVAPPTVDTAAPTPTSPMPGGPPTGSAPDGSTVGGQLLHTRGVVVTDGAPPAPAVKAPGWLVADLGTGTVLGARDPHGRYYPASTLKTLTLLTLLHRLPPDQVVTATTDDENVEGTRVGLVNGGQYPVALLFQALVLGSGNDVANALARANGGVPATVTEMNALARSLGADDTVAGTVSGLDVAGQSSSPYDLALFFRALLADPAAAAVVATPKIALPPEMGKPGFEVDNEDPLLRTYAGDLGGKNGFTDAARHTFVTAAERGGRRLVVTLMGANRQPGVDEYAQAAQLLDWGFSVPATAPGVGRLVTAADLTTAPAPASASESGSGSTRAGSARPPTDSDRSSGRTVSRAVLTAIGVALLAIVAALTWLMRRTRSRRR